MSWKDLKLARKLYAGFGMVLVLALLIGWFGYNGLSTVETKVACASDADQIVKWIKDMGAARAAFNFTEDRKHYEDLKETLGLVYARFDETRTRLDDESDIALLDGARAKLEAYAEVWADWVEVSDASKLVLVDITADADVFEQQLAALRESQEQQMLEEFRSRVDHGILRNEVDVARGADNMAFLFSQTRVTYRNWRLSDDDEYATLYDEQLGDVIAQAEATRARMSDPENIARLNEIQAACEGIRESFKTVLARKQEFREVARNLASEAAAVVADIDAFGRSQKEAMAEAQTSAVTLAVGAAAGAVLFGIFIAFFIARGISRPVSRMAEVAQAISVGDIDHSIDLESRDEIGVLADSFRRLIDYMKELAEAAAEIAANNLTISVDPKSDKDVLGQSFATMLSNLSNMIRQLTDSANDLVSAANEISSSAEEVSRGAESQARQVEQVTTAMEEMSATIVQSAKNAGEATDGSRNASETAQGGGQIVNDTITGMQRIADVVRQSADNIAKLARSADQIGEITRVIDDIADQTNLLALNAAIEAARAGEQGRGFAVVADEVRKLAERTGKATGEISNMIKGIQHGTEEAVTSMEQGIQEVDSGRELADKAGNSLTEIVTMSQRVMDMIQQLATASEQQSAAAEQISRNIEAVSSVTKESAAGAEQAAAAAEELNRNAEGLREMISQFRIDNKKEETVPA